LDLGAAIGLQHGLVGGTVDHGPADLNQAHAAHAHRIQLGMVAENGDVDAGHLGRIDDQRPFWDCHFFFIDLECYLFWHTVTL